MGRRRPRLLGVIASAALALPLAGGCRKKADAPVAVAPADRPAELRMQGLIVQSWGVDGLEWEMRSPVGEGFTQRGLIQVSHMNVQLFEKGERSTEITAERALMATGNPVKDLPPAEPLPGVVLSSGDMFLDGNVVVVSTEGSHLKTDWAHYSVKDKIIRSSAPVEVERPDSLTRGTGLEATADLSTLKIFNQTLVIPDREKKK